ncbi:MAG: NADP(H)-dependent aldo-keto reductase [Candidatus Kaiserbacteria bacterium]|nr:MAG: NADP(H)-dependent aldo-keto reductase [Candidatus Kaiserbacteria bacterium]
MRYTALPRTDLKVSAVCLGSMNWGQQNTEAEGHEQLDYAISQGINFIDTAEIYPVPPVKEKQGDTESFIGSWLQRRGKRKDLVIASKVAGPEAPLRYRATPTRLDRKNILAAIDGTLERLHTDYVDIYQVHWPDRATNYFGIRGYEQIEREGVPIEETLEALAEVVQSGKARYIGVSNETPWGVMEYVRLAKEKSLPRIVSIQNQYSLLNRTFEIGLSEMCLKEEIALLAYSPLSFGSLTGKYLDGARPPGARFTLWNRSSQRYNAPHSQKTIAKYVALAKDHGLDPAELSIAFVVSRPFVSSTIIGATSLDQLKTNIIAGDITLSAEVLEGIAQIYLENPDPHA